MSVVYIVLPIAVVLAVVAMAAFIWSVRSGQMDDLETPGVRLLIEEDDTPPQDEESEKGSAS